MDSDPEAALFLGDGPLSRYADHQLIGVGVSARVYKAVDTTTDSWVAVKVLNPHLKTDEISVERFRRAQLSSGFALSSTAASCLGSPREA